MSALKKVLEAMPSGSLVPRDWVLKNLDRVESDCPEVLSTVQAARVIGYSPKWWRVRCERGEIEAWQDSEGGPWRFTAEAARKHLAAKQVKKATGRRGPYRKEKTPAPQALHIGSEDMETGKVLELRPQAVGRHQARPA